MGSRDGGTVRGRGEGAGREDREGKQEGVNPVALLLRESLRSAAPRLPASSPLLELRIRGVKFVSSSTTYYSTGVVAAAAAAAAAAATAAAVVVATAAVRRKRANGASNPTGTHPPLETPRPFVCPSDLG